jgi:transposase
MGNKQAHSHFQETLSRQKMVLICDNAPYHHKREIGSMDKKTKKQLVEMMAKDDVNYIELPVREDRTEYMDEVGAPLISMEEDHGGAAIINISAPGDDESGGVQRLSDAMRIKFIANEQIKSAGTNKPRVGTVQELKASYILWLKRHKPERLECKFEALLKDHEFEVLWTPPYCPDLQPIELFWAAGKNHVAMLFSAKRTMKETVKQLREGWYGSFEVVQPGETRKKHPVSCNKLYETSIKSANEKFIPMCQGSIKGTIGNLWIDPNYIEPTVDVPIDTLLNKYTTDMIAVDEDDDTDD